jgi:hypothetical protein
MEHPCYKCGQILEEGIPFCPHCSAPQIRVMVAEPAAAVVLPDQTGTAVLAEAQAPAATVNLSLPWSAAFRPCALAALVASLLMSLGLNPFVAMLSVGFLAVAFYRHRWPGAVIKPAAGVRLGALSGLLWFAISSILEATAVLFMHKGPEIQHELLKRIDQAASQTTDPQALAIFDRLKTAGGLEFLMVFGIIFAFIAAIIFAVIGGALGGALLGRNNRG